MSANPSPTSVILALEIPKAAPRKTPALNFADNNAATQQIDGGQRFKDLMRERSSSERDDGTGIHAKKVSRHKNHTREDNKLNSNDELKNKVTKENSNREVNKSADNEGDSGPRVDDNDDAVMTNAPQQTDQPESQSIVSASPAPDTEWSIQPSVDEPVRDMIALPVGEEWRVAIGDDVAVSLRDTTTTSPATVTDGGKELPLAATSVVDGHPQLETTSPATSGLVEPGIGTTTQVPAIDSSLTDIQAAPQNQIAVASVAVSEAEIKTDGITTAEQLATSSLTAVEEVATDVATETNASLKDAATTDVSTASSTLSVRVSDEVTQRAQAVVSKPMEQAAANNGPTNPNTASANQATAAHNATQMASETLQLLQEARGDFNIQQPALSAHASSTAKDTAEAKLTGLQTATSAIDAKWAQSVSQLRDGGFNTRPLTMQTSVPFNADNGQMFNGKWFNAVAERVMWLASRNIQAAELHLDPPELGPVQVRVAVNHDQASVNFVSHHVSVREALDFNINRLRDMFANEGLNLVDVDVSDRSLQQQSGDRDQSTPGNATGDVSAQGETEGSNVALTPIKITHLVDHYI